MKGHRALKRGVALTVRVGDSVKINGDIELVVTKVKSNAARLKIFAPEHIKILRVEKEVDQ